MIRFILRRHGIAAGPRPWERLETLDLRAPELRALLCRGGFAEDTYDQTDLVGVEILPDDGDKIVDPAEDSLREDATSAVMEAVGDLLRNGGYLNPSPDRAAVLERRYSEWWDVVHGGEVTADQDEEGGGAIVEASEHD